MNRREFIKSASALAALSGCRSFGSNDGSYSVAILGDTHFDAESADTYHHEFLKTERIKNMPWCPKEFKRNGFLWRKDGPSRALVAASSRSVLSDTKFVLQLGDLVQGDCDTAALHRQMLTEMSSILEAAYPADLPILSVCGNHDLRPGGNFDVSAAYREFAEGWRRRNFHARRGEAPKSGVSFSFTQGPDAWIIIDFNHPDLALLERLLKESEGARYTFVCMHSPVLPMSAWRKRYFYFASEKQTEQRRAARALMAKRNVIVLAGHEHRLEHRVWEGDGGKIVEFVANSVACEELTDPNPAIPAVFKRNPSELGIELENAKTSEEISLRDLYREYKPGLRTLYAARGSGHYRLEVNDDGVQMFYFGHDSLTPHARWQLA